MKAAEAMEEAIPAVVAEAVEEVSATAAEGNFGSMSAAGMEEEESSSDEFDEDSDEEARLAELDKPLTELAPPPPVAAIAAPAAPVVAAAARPPPVAVELALLPQPSQVRACFDVLPGGDVGRGVTVGKLVVRGEGERVRLS